MLTAVGVKVTAEMSALAGFLIFLIGLALRGRPRERATGGGAVIVGLAGLVLLAEVLFGQLDTNQISTGAALILMGAAWIVYQRKRPTLV